MSRVEFYVGQSQTEISALAELLEPMRDKAWSNATL